MQVLSGYPEVRYRQALTGRMAAERVVAMDEGKLAL